MKDVELRLISELMKNSRRSDRDLAKAIGVSQPTLTRTRTRLEREGYIREYTMIPDFTKIGYAILALTFVRLRKGLDPEEVAKARKMVRSRLSKGSYGLVMIERGIGLDYDGVIVSYHESYASYLCFLDKIKGFKFFVLSKIESFLIDLYDEIQNGTITLTTMAKHLLTLKEKEKKE